MGNTVKIRGKEYKVMLRVVTRWHPNILFDKFTFDNWIMLEGANKNIIDSFNEYCAFLNEDEKIKLFCIPFHEGYYFPIRYEAILRDFVDMMNNEPT